MTSLPLASVITPCYNHEKYLDEYFEGLLSQTYTHVELIFLDDGSADGSWEKVMSYESRLKNKFSKVILERHENIGFLPEVASALERAAGEFFCLIGSDDTYLPTMLEEVVTYLLAHPEKGMVHGDTDYVYDDRIERQHWKSTGRQIPQGFVFEDLLKRNFVMMCSACFRTDLLRRHGNFKNYTDRNYVVEDYPLLLDLARHTEFGYIDKSLARYRVLSESMSHSKDPNKLLQFCKSIYRIKRDYIKKYGAADKYRLLANKGWFRSLYYVGYDLDMKETAFQGYKWLRKNYPEEYGNYWHRARALSMHNRFTWKVVKEIERRQVLHKTKKFLKLVPQ